MSGPRPGMFGLVQGEGLVGAGIRLGQRLIGDRSPYTHAFVVVDDDQIVEAQPQGAILAPRSKYDQYTVTYSWSITLSGREEHKIVTRALSLIGTRYGFSDYLALALHHWRIRPPRLERYIASNNRMICSQLVDEVYLNAGIHLFSDGRAPGDVTPGDLARVLQGGVA
jgi:hypothetical protein